MAKKYQGMNPNEVPMGYRYYDAFVFGFLSVLMVGADDADFQPE